MPLFSYGGSDNHVLCSSGHSFYHIVTKLSGNLRFVKPSAKFVSQQNRLAHAQTTAFFSSYLHGEIGHFLTFLSITQRIIKQLSPNFMCLKHRDTRRHSAKHYAHAHYRYKMAVEKLRFKGSTLTRHPCVTF